jgi:hypothetical protein
MAGMGPAPKDPTKRARRNAAIAMTQLPAEGRKGTAPKWPLRPDMTAIRARLVAEQKVERLREQLNDEEDGRKIGRLERQLDVALAEAEAIEVQLAEQRGMELELWRGLWKTPQAVMWERLCWTREVAQYVRWKVLAELGSLDASKEARQLADRLGLSPLAMLRLRWAVAADEVGARRAAKKTPAKATGSRARRGPLRVVKDRPKAAGDG